MKTVPAASRFLFGTVAALTMLMVMPASPAPVEPTGPVIAENYYDAKPGKADEACRWRVHASDLRARLGFPRGRVLCHTSHAPAGSSATMPDVVWECEYPSEQARARHYAKINANPEFRGVEQHMQTLLRRFDAGTYVQHEKSSDVH